MKYIQDIYMRSSIRTENYNTGLIGIDNNSSWGYADQAQKAAVDAHVFAGKVYDYLLKVRGRNSFDNAGSTMLSVVEDPTCGSPYWDNDDKMVNYCAGTRFGGALDFVAHEWGHAVTMSKPNPLGGSGEPGALNEAFSDWMGIAVECNNGNCSDWTIGEALIPPKGFRSLSDPPSVPSYSLDWRPIPPDTYMGANWLTTGEACSDNNDYCYVHINNGVPNKMFYLLAQGGTHPVTNISVQGIGIDRAMSIAYKANMQKWDANTEFQDARDDMAALSGLTSNEKSQIKNAWAAVGVGTVPMITVSASPSAGGTVDGGGSYDWGESATVTATANPGYHFTKWTEGGTSVSTSASYQFTVTGSRTLVANFAATAAAINISPASWAAGTSYIGDESPPLRTFTVSNPGLNSMTVSSASITGTNYLQFQVVADNCSGLSLTTDASCTVIVAFKPTATGSKSASLYIQGRNDSTGANLTKTAALTGTGKTGPTFTITTSVTGSGSISPSSPAVLQGNSQTFTITPDSGNGIGDVQVDGVSQGGVSSYTFSEVYSTHSISVTFLPTYYITTAAGPGGSITPSFSVTSGHDYDVFITSDFGYYIANVVVDGIPIGSSDTYTFYNVASNHSITATFVLYPERIVNPSGYVTSYGTSLQSAYNITGAGDTIQTQAITFVGDLLINRPGPVTLQGGYSYDYSAVTATPTTVKGSLTITGPVTIRNLTVAK